MDDKLMESLEPYNFKEAVPFQQAYLAGYVADKYDVDAKTSEERANERIKRSTENAFAETVSDYDSVSVENSNIRLSEGKAKYALYPTWILNTTWNGDKYVFAMNGQTGKFVGNLPMDKSLFWSYFFKTTGITALILYALQFIVGLFKQVAIGSMAHGPMIGFAVVVGLIIGLIRVLIMKSSLTSVVAKNTAADYVRPNSFKLTDKADIFMYSKTEKEEKPNKES